MRQILGIAGNSASFVTDLVSPMCEKYGASLCIVGEETPDKAQVYLVSSFRLFKRHAEALNERKAVIVITETPFLLMAIKGIKWLDLDDEPGLSYLFKWRKVDQEALKKAIKAAAAKEVDPLEIKVKKLEVLPKLLSVVREGTMLDKMNKLIYESSNHRTRNNIRSYITTFLFEGRELEWVEAKLKKRMTTKTGLANVDVLIDFLKSDVGRRITKACIKVGKRSNEKNSKGERKQVPYEDICEKYQVSKSEIKTLAKIARLAVQEKSFPSGTIGDALLTPRGADEKAALAAAIS